MTLIIIIVIGLALCFDFLNGIHDSSNIVATMISSRAITPRLALGLTATAEFIGPFIFGVAVANTIGHEIVNADKINIAVIIAALTAAIFWNLFTWYAGIPSSSSHALIGGIIGAVIIGAGYQEIKLSGIEKVLIALFSSPIIGIICGYIVMKVILYFSSYASPKINWFFKRSQLFTALILAFSHGTNDAQKTMGIITLSLVLTGYINKFQVPYWVIALSAGAIATGTALGGWRLIKTLGAKFYKIRPIHAFATQVTAATVIIGNSIMGGPVSTTQVVSTAIMGVGSADRVNKVRWGVAKEIGLAWILTIPSTAFVSAGFYWLLSHYLPQLTLIR